MFQKTALMIAMESGAGRGIVEVCGFDPGQQIFNAISWNILPTDREIPLF